MAKRNDEQQGNEIAADAEQETGFVVVGLGARKDGSMPVVYKGVEVNLAVATQEDLAFLFNAGFAHVEKG